MVAGVSCDAWETPLVRFAALNSWQLRGGMLLAAGLLLPEGGEKRLGALGSRHARPAGCGCGALRCGSTCNGRSADCGSTITAAQQPATYFAARRARKSVLRHRRRNCKVQCAARRGRSLTPPARPPPTGRRRVESAAGAKQEGAVA